MQFASFVHELLFGNTETVPFLLEPVGKGAVNIETKQEILG